jgi:hypothetical protein
MTTETQNKDNSRPVRIRMEKVERAARVARMRAAKEDKKVSMVAVLDQVLEEGLSRIERKLGIK